MCSQYEIHLLRKVKFFIGYENNELDDINYCLIPFNDDSIILFIN